MREIVREAYQQNLKPIPVSKSELKAARTTGATKKLKAIFKDEAALYDILGTYFLKVQADPKLFAPLKNSGLKIRFNYSAPDGSIALDGSTDDKSKQVLTGDAARAFSPEVEFTLSADVAHYFWHGQVNLMQALARKGVIELVSGTSRGIRLQSDTLRSIHESRVKQFSLPLPSLAQLALPLVGRVAAGSPILAQEHVDQTYYVESSLFQRQPDYLLKVRGMSMRDVGIMDGDLLAVKTCHEARNGQIIVARLGDDVTVKRLRRTAQGVELLPENPDYPVIVVHPGEPFAIEGLAVGLIRNTMLM